MLEYLRIRNLALIEDVALDLAPGLNVLSGETGAGKSFIMKALNFLTGEKLDAGMVRPGQDKAGAEALFVLSPEEPGNGGEEEKILRRELSADTGRSRVFVNDALSSQETVKALRPRLILHTSQHGQQRLLQPAYQARILDGFLKDPGLVERKAALLRSLREMAERRRGLEERSRALSEQREYLEYQQGLIAKVAPQPGEEDELEARRREIRDQAQAGQSAQDAVGLLAAEGGVLDAVAEIQRHVRAVARAVPEHEADAEKLEEFRQELLDLESRLRRNRLAADERDLESIEARLFALSQLKRKLKRELDAIVDMGREIEENLSFLDQVGLDLKQLAKQEAALAGELGTALGSLNAARRDAAGRLSDALEAELRGLGFSEHVQVRCEFTPHEVWPGLHEDRVRFLWLPNPGQSPQPLDRIASGGELSRFLLALVGLLGEADLPTLIFDEVDAGVGGITLGRLGERLRDLSRRQQVILITHWPQLAAMADRHFLVRKEVRDGQTYTLCQRLEENDVFDELTRMAGGGDQGRAMARELRGEG
jgi:DNA repair protein RecN (Recombination protein N)